MDFYQKSKNLSTLNSDKDQVQPAAEYARVRASTVGVCVCVCVCVCARLRGKNDQKNSMNIKPTYSCLNVVDCGSRIWVPPIFFESSAETVVEREVDVWAEVVQQQQHRQLHQKDHLHQGGVLEGVKKRNQLGLIMEPLSVGRNSHAGLPSGSSTRSPTWPLFLLSRPGLEASLT